MEHLALLLVLGACLGVGGWQLALLISELRTSNKKYKAATAAAVAAGKPLLVVGGPWGISRRRRWFLRVPAHGHGDVCLDIDPRAFDGYSCGIIADVRHIPLADKSFGAVFVGHVLEHLPTVADALKALTELNRVAEAVFIAYPSRQYIVAQLIPDHHLWIWQKGNMTYLKQRGKSGSKNKEVYYETGKIY